MGRAADNFIDASAADRLIAAHDGDVALLYIYLARTGSRDLERAAHDLCRQATQEACTIATATGNGRPLELAERIAASIEAGGSEKQS